MSRRTPQPEGVAKPKPPFSSVVVDGDLAFTAGQVGFNEHGEVVPGGIEAQTRKALENLLACLSAAGCGPADVLKVNAFLADLGEFETYNAVYREFFQEPYPARTTVGATLPGELRVEIEAVARVPQ
jgi:2-iminobutanoate/2-iminopropanoate deaminase